MGYERIEQNYRNTEKKNIEILENFRSEKLSRKAHQFGMDWVKNGVSGMYVKVDGLKK